MTELAHVPGTSPPLPRRGNGLAVTAMVLGITGTVFCWWGIATLAMAVLALTFGAIGLTRAGQGAPGKGMAITGLALGSVALVTYLILGIATAGVFLLI